MAVEKIVARMYDLNPATPKTTQASENGFEEAMKTATEKSDKEVCSYCATHAADSTVDSSSQTSEAAESDAASSASDSESNETFAYRFSMFVRVTSSHEQVASGLGSMFHQAARGVVNALKSDESCGCNLIDNFFSKAQAKVDVGINQSQNFLKDIIEAADTGIKSISNAMLGNSWMSGMASMSGMSGMNLSMNSSMPGTSGSDIAGLYLKEAMNSMSSYGSSAVGSSATSKGSAGLQLISSSQISSSKIETAVPEENKTEKIGEKRLELLDKFLAMMDEFMEKSPPESEKPFFSQIELAIFRATGSGEAVKTDETDSAEEVSKENNEAAEVAETVTV